VFTEIADSLKTEVSLSSNDPVVPYIDFDRAANRDAVIDLTEQLLRKEERDAQELRRLQRELRVVKDTSLWGLLVDLMERDTKKHIAILRFVKKHTGRRKR